jgi:23S rRNA (uracil1939-C5)-methyltransferase
LNAIFAYNLNCWRQVHGPHAVVEYLTFGVGVDDDEGGWGGAMRPGPPFLIPLHFPPNNFPQANLDASAGIGGRIRERISRDFRGGGDDNVPCVELYGGVGTIGLHVSDLVSDLVSSLVCSDENPNNGRCFANSVWSLPPKVQSRLAYHRKNAADMIATKLPLFRGCRVLIVDPPRKGLDDEVVDYLCREEWRGGNMKLVVYVSCGFRAFQRDCDALMRSSRWKVALAEGYRLSLGSDAIENSHFLFRRRKDFYGGMLTPN